MGWIKDGKASIMKAEAQKAWDSGDRYFTAVLNFPGGNPNLSGGIPHWPPMLEAIEAVGWKLHTWAMAVDHKGHPHAMPLFVRP